MLGWNQRESSTHVSNSTVKQSGIDVREGPYINMHIRREGVGGV